MPIATLPKFAFAKLLRENRFGTIGAFPRFISTCLIPATMRSSQFAVTRK
jgi:hypothetical protein